MDRRTFTFFIVPLLFGCGGHSRGTAENPHVLGEAALDLAIVGSTTPPAVSMRGTGEVYGSLTLNDHTFSPNEGSLSVVAVLATSSVVERQGLTQTLVFSLRHTGPLAVGAQTEFDAAANTVDYDEHRYTLFGGTSTLIGWGASDETQGGTAEVTAVGNGRITVRLAGVRITRSGGQDPIAIDGTLSGPLTTN